MTDHPLSQPPKETPVAADPWHRLRRFTDARIALGRAGVSLPTREMLAFQLAHARARDAVHQALAPEAMRDRLAALGLASVTVHSAAAHREAYLRRPDLGRELDEDSRRALRERAAPEGYDLALVIADGLSALAVVRNALPLIEALGDRLVDEEWRMAPCVIALQGRVALGDDIGACLGARAVAVLIGERPGLSSPDSLGVYLTQAPRPGLTDERRNCISNVRPAGLGYGEAARRLHYLLGEARRRGLSGVALKDETESAESGRLEARDNFLTNR